MQKDWWIHCKTYIFRGILAAIPLGLSFFVIWFFYVMVDRKVVNLIHKVIGFRIPGLGILLVLFSLYIIGYLASNVIGRRFFSLLENISNRIPIIKTTYQVGKQLSSTLSLPEGQVFKRVVLVDYFKPDVWVIGFVTGSLEEKTTKEKFLKVFVPHVPSPTSGFLVIVKESQVRDSAWTVEEGIRMVISGGLIGPETIAINQREGEAR
ncbi:MAG: DUF502 domain-containing protein [Candidatus Omnitrophica bacterium]|nr:DUF502 domain-containing protein [Candidatus Omnitrophota bacterium]